jgi:hypothetical protein
LNKCAVHNLGDLNGSGCTVSHWCSALAPFIVSFFYRVSTVLLTFDIPLNLDISYITGFPRSFEF